MGIGKIVRVVLDEGVDGGERVRSAAADRWRGKRGTEKPRGSAPRIDGPPTKDPRAATAIVPIHQDHVERRRAGHVRCGAVSADDVVRSNDDDERRAWRERKQNDTARLLEGRHRFARERFGERAPYRDD